MFSFVNTINIIIANTACAVFLCLLIVAFPASQAVASCTSPAGEAGDIIFNADHAVMQYCNDTDWISFPKNDLTPDALVFNALTGQSVATLVTSNTVTIAGIAGTASVGISGDGTPEFRINGGAWGTTGSVVEGDTIQLRMTTGAPSTQHVVTVVVGLGSAEWEVATVGADTTPNAFTFSDVTAAATSTLTTSSAITITGINSATPVSVSGDGSPQIRINGGAWVTSGSISNGQTLAVRLTSSSVIEETRSATIDVGGVTDQWDVTTAAPVGQQVFTASGSFVVPANVTSVSLVAVGCGGEGASGSASSRGGDLRWHSGLSVTPGETLAVEISTSGGPTRVRRGGTDLLVARGGNSGTSTSIGGSVGGGNGGSGQAGPGEGGGGAGGYGGNGGDGATERIVSGGCSGHCPDPGGTGKNGNGGGGGGGGADSNATSYRGGGGGGVGLLGQGASGAGGVYGTGTALPNRDGAQGQGGSGGQPFNNTSRSANGGLYGGGAANSAAQGGGGAVRFIWGTGRAYPSTNTQDF